MDWKQWAFDTVVPAVSGIVPAASVYGGGALTGSPSEKPFLVLAFGQETPELNDGDAPLVTSQALAIWVHDEPGTYETINQLLLMLRGALVGQVPHPGATGCFWTGDSADLADDIYGTIVRNANFRLVGGS